MIYSRIQSILLNRPTSVQAIVTARPMTKVFRTTNSVSDTVAAVAVMSMKSFSSPQEQLDDNLNSIFASGYDKGYGIGFEIGLIEGQESADYDNHETTNDLVFELMQKIDKMQIEIQSISKRLESPIVMHASASFSK